MTKSLDSPGQHQFITIVRNSGRSRVFSFPKALCEAYALSQFSYGTLYFDKSQRRIAFRFTNEYKSGGFALTKAPGGRLNLVASGFFSKYGLDPEKDAGRYKVRRHRSRALGIDEPDYSFVIKLRRTMRRQAT